MHTLCESFVLPQRQRKSLSDLAKLVSSASEPEDIEAIPARKHEIEEHDVNRLSFETRNGFLRNRCELQITTFGKHTIFTCC